MKPQAIFVLLLAFCNIHAQTNYHVSKIGDDNNSGASNDPFLTISKAASIVQAGDVVTIHEGTYEETLTPANSGTAGNPILFQGSPGEQVIISALEALDDWTLDQGNIYKTQVNWDLGQKNMVMNGFTLCDLARWPNNTDGDPFSLNSVVTNWGDGSDENTIYNAYITNSGIPNYDWTGGSVFFFSRTNGWTAWKAFINSSSAGQVNFDLVKNPAWIRTSHAPNTPGDFYLEGIREALDYENEWYFDDATNTLYIQLPNGAAPLDEQISMRRRNLTVDLINKNYINLLNLTVIGGGIKITGNNNSLYNISNFYGSHTRGVVTGFLADESSVEVGDGSQNTNIQHCHIAYGSATGIRDKGDYTNITNCSIHDFNYLGFYDSPIHARNGSHTSIKNCDLYRAGRDVIQIVNKDSNIAFNDVSQASLIAHDCALLYTIGPNLNMNIHNNYFHDSEARDGLYKSAGVYLDNDAGDVNVYRNVIANLPDWPCIQINWDARNIDVFNNTLWNSQAAMGAWHKAGTSFDDVRVWNNLTNMNSLEPQSDKQNNLIMANNANPFTDKDNDDYTLVGGSQPIDYGKIIAGYTDGYNDAAPDVGAYEYGDTPWEAGIDWTPYDITRQSVYHVSKTGNDANLGTASSPFLTITRAADVAIPGDSVIIHVGTYEETLNPMNSGAAGSPIVFRAATGEKVVISALEALSGWTADQNFVYKKQLSWDLGQDNMVMNGNTLCQLARWPNDTDGDLFTLDAVRNDGGSDGSIEYGAYLTDTDIPNYDWTGGSLHFFDDTGSGGLAWKAFITSSSTGQVNFDLDKNLTWIRTAFPPQNQGQYYLEGVRDALDIANEWYFDDSDNTLYIKLPNGAVPANGQVSMRRRTHTIDLIDRNYIEIYDISVIGGMIDMNGQNNKLKGVSSFHGGYTRGIVGGFSADKPSVDVKWNCENTIIEDCTIAYGVATGIRDRGSNTHIINSNIHDFNSLGYYDAAIMATDGSDTKITNCTVARAGKDVIRVWNKNSIISHSDISQGGLINSECAAIHTGGANLNLELHHNIIHDMQVPGSLYKAAGIYMENSPTDVSIHHNVITGVSEWSSIQINQNAANIDVFNNTIWDGVTAMGAWHAPGTSFTNVRVWNNLTNMNSLETQSDRQNNLIIQDGSNPFADSGNLDFTLSAGVQAIDYGQVIAGITDGYMGVSPDAGAYEYGGTTWQAGASSQALTPYTNCIAGFIEAENFINQSGTFTETTSDTGGGTNVGYIQAGDYLDYDVEVLETSCYKIEFRVAAPNNPIHFALKQGSTVLTTVNHPATGGWQNWVTVTAYVFLNEGRQELRIEALGDDWNINWMNFTEAFCIPDLIEAEDYTAQNGTMNEPTADTNGGENVGYMDPGDYLEYELIALEEGCYKVEFRVAAQNTRVNFYLKEGTTILTTIDAPPTGSWQTWETVSAIVYLSAGAHNLRIEAITNAWNINWMRFTTTDCNAPDGCAYWQVKTYLQGPLKTSNMLMDDAIKSLLPASDAYGLGYNLPSSATSTTGNDAVVDWIKVELRNVNTPTIVAATMAGLLQRDGDIVDMHGVPQLQFCDIPAGQYHVVVKHRNHLGVMTNTGVITVN